MFDKEYEMVQGDVFNLNDLEKAMIGCDAVHISISNVNEGLATKSAGRKWQASAKFNANELRE